MVKERPIGYDETATFTGIINELFDIVLHFLRCAQVQQSRGHISQETGVLTKGVLGLLHICQINHPQSLALWQVLDDFET